MVNSIRESVDDFRFQNRKRTHEYRRPTSDRIGPNDMPEAIQPDDHLSRLLAPQDTELPWYKSLYQSVHELIKPEKLPPLELTSRPVAVKDMWGLYKNEPKNLAYSVAFQAALLAIAIWGFNTPTVQKAIKEKMNLIDPNLKPFVPDVKPKNNAMQGGGGGGARETFARFEGPSSQAFDEAVCAPDDCGSHAETGHGSFDPRTSRYATSAVDAQQLGRSAGQADERLERKRFGRRHG